MSEENKIIISKLFSSGLLDIDYSVGFLDYDICDALEFHIDGNHEVTSILMSSYSRERNGDISSAKSMINELISKNHNNSFLSIEGLMLAKIGQLRLEYQFSAPSCFAEAFNETKSFYLKNKSELTEFKTTILFFEAELNFREGKYQKAFDLWIEYQQNLKPYAFQLVYLQSFALTKIAKINQKLGRYSEAIENFQKSLNIVSEDKGIDHYLYALILNELAEIYDEIGDLKKSLELRLEALSIFRNSYSTNLHFGDILKGYASTLELSGKYHEALEVAVEAVEENETLLCDNHEKTAESLNRKASVLEKLGRTREALNIRVATLEIMKELFEEPNHKIALAINNLAALYGYGGAKNKKALDLQMQALVMYQNTLGEKHPETCFVLANVGCKMSDLGRHEDGISNIRNALHFHEEALGKDHPDNAYFLGNLGLCLNQNGKHLDALEAWEKGYEVRIKAFGANHIETARSMVSVASGLLNVGKDAEKALTIAEKALGITVKLIGEHSNDAIWAIDAVGRCLGRLGKLEESIKRHKQAFRIAKQTLGPKNNNTKFFKKALKQAEFNQR